MSKKALFFDIDGTLLSETTRQIPESAKEALKEARRNGHVVFINSGRSYVLVEPLLNEVETDGALCGCGTCIAIDGKEVYACHVPYETGIKLRKAIKEFGVEAVLEGSQGCYFNEKPYHTPWMERLRLNVNQEMGGPSHCLEDTDYEFDKFCMTADDKVDLEGFFKVIEEDFTIINRGGFYECVLKGHSKATAIQWVLDYYGIPLKDAYVFGDSMNDLSMFEFAENAVLMGKHDKGLEPYATFTTKTVEEDGIAWAMKELGII